jgi:hypothetical protein
VDAHVLKLQCLQNRVLPATVNLDRRAQVVELYVAFKIPYVYEYINKLCRTQATVILKYVNPNVRGIGQRDIMRGKCKKLKLGSRQA